MGHVKTLRFWMLLFAALACVGLPMMLVGKFIGSKPVIYFGVVLGAPLLTSAALIVIIALPYGLWIKTQERRRDGRG